MAIIEQSRHELHEYLTEWMDKERAAKVMEVIPAVDWADLATKQDLRQEIAGLRIEMYKALGDVHKALTWHTLSVIGATGTMVGLAFGLAHWL